jgi:acyl-CoA thioesterase FadM
MNNGKYFSILDVARVDYMIRNGLYAELSRKGYYPVVVAETIRFRKALNLFQKFDVVSVVVGWDEKAFLLSQEFRIGSEVMAAAVIRARFLKKSGGTVTPTEVLRLLNYTQSSPTIPAWIAEWNKVQAN